MLLKSHLFLGMGGTLGEAGEFCFPTGSMSTGYMKYEKVKNEGKNEIKDNNNISNNNCSPFFSNVLYCNSTYMCFSFFSLLSKTPILSGSFMFLQCKMTNHSV